MRFVIIISTFIGLSLGLVGCSSQPLSARGEAVYFALEQDSLLRNWVERCSQVNLDVRRQAKIAKQQWWERNGLIIEAADFGLAYDMLNISDTRVETGARLAMAVTWNIVAEAEQNIEKKLHKADSAQVCEDVLRAYNQGEFDLSQHKKYYEQLIVLQGLKQQRGEDLELKQAMVIRSSKKEFGRSLAVVEKTAKRYGCEAPRVQLIKNAYPHELYDVSCYDNSHLFAQCEWSNCRLIK